MADKPRYHPDAFRLDPKSVAVGMIIRNAIGCQLKVLELICNKTRVIYRVVQTPEDERNFLNKEGQVEVVEFAERAVAVMKEPQVLNAVPNRSINHDH